MKNADILNIPVIIHWWNFRKKQIDFKGTLEDCLKSKGVKYKTKKRDDGGYIFTFTFQIGSSEMTYKATTTEYGFIRAARDVLSFQLTYLGDKAQIHIQNNGTATINH